MEKESYFNKPEKKDGTVEEEQFDRDKIRSMLNPQNKKLILEQIGENPYKSDLRNEINFLFSNLDRALSHGLVNKEEIEEAVRESLSGERETYAPINLTAEEKEKISKILIDMIVKNSKIEN